MDKPLLVSAVLIKPILEGTKTLTSRLSGLEEINAMPGFWQLDQFKQLDKFCVAVFKNMGTASQLGVECPYGGLGSHLWVREGWYVGKGYNGVKPRDLPKTNSVKVGYIADGPRPDWAGKGRAAIHLPRYFSRATLQLTGLACERVQDISEHNAQLEGCGRSSLTLTDSTGFTKITSADGELGTYYDGFKSTWIGLNGRESWERNPWVWRLHFKLLNNFPT